MLYCSTTIWPSCYFWAKHCAPRLKDIPHSILSTKEPPRGQEHMVRCDHDTAKTSSMELIEPVEHVELCLATSLDFMQDCFLEIEHSSRPRLSQEFGFRVERRSQNASNYTTRCAEAYLKQLNMRRERGV